MPGRLRAIEDTTTNGTAFDRPTVPATISGHSLQAREMLESSAESIRACMPLSADIAEVANCIADAFEGGHKLLVCGNGGSAADAQHFVGELMGHFLASASTRAPRPALALTADSAVLTAISNDYRYEDVFARQVKALAQPGDVLVGISTSGRSENVLRAFAAAPVGTLKVALTGRTGSLADAGDFAIRVPWGGTAPIQAAHGAIIHAICIVLEARFAAQPGSEVAEGPLSRS